ncbi:hypothetical protein NQU17_00330 [Clostridiaceae bacterium HFYG-1003]|nr:hypothetical protein NQU17_00330 [Clostridiaceae bacterium HFYG-1003]
MNVKDTARRWGRSEKVVRTYCQEGIVPSAEKKGRFWDIPQNAPAPPLTRHGLVLLLESILLQADGAAVNVRRIGYPEIEVVLGYRYLSDQLFISGFSETEPIEKALAQAKCTQRGRKLIAAHEESKNKGRKMIAGEIGINAGKPHILGKFEKDDS